MPSPGTVDRSELTSAYSLQAAIAICLQAYVVEYGFLAAHSLLL